MENKTIILIVSIVISYCINIYLFNKISKRNGCAEPFALIFGFFPFIGTIMLSVFELINYLDRFYTKK